VHPLYIIALLGRTLLYNFCFVFASSDNPTKLSYIDIINGLEPFKQILTDKMIQLMPSPCGKANNPSSRA
jgi:hypothetical protein